MTCGAAVHEALQAVSFAQQRTPPDPPLPFADRNCGSLGQNSRDRAIVPHDLGAAALASGHSLPSIWVSPKVRIF